MISNPIQHFNRKKALEKAIKGLSTGGISAALAAGVVWGFRDSISGISGNEALLVTILTGIFTSIGQAALNTWKHRKGT